MNDKVEVVINILDQSGQDEGFFNIIKLEAFYRLEMIKAYTNISFTDKQLEDTPKLYDAITMNNVWEMVENNIPKEERDYIWHAVREMGDAITQYNRSIAGMLKSLAQDYSALDIEAVNLQKKLNTPEVMAVLKHFLPEAGLTD